MFVSSFYFAKGQTHFPNNCVFFSETERKMATPKGKTVLDLDRYLGQQITVKFAGGREGTRFPFMLHTLKRWQ